MPPPPPLHPHHSSTRLGAPSLFQCASKTLIKNIDQIYDVGCLDLRLVKHIVAKVTDPYKLRNIEKNSPQVAGHFVDLWKKFISRDFGADPEKYVPNNLELWHKIYAKHAKEHAEAVKASSDLLISKFSALKEAKAKLQPTVLSHPAKYSWARPGVAPPRHLSYYDGRDVWAPTTGSRTKDVFKKIRREIKANKPKMMVPTHMLQARTPISQAVITKLSAKASSESLPLLAKRPLEGTNYDFNTAKRMKSSEAGSSKFADTREDRPAQSTPSRYDGHGLSSISNSNAANSGSTTESLQSSLHPPYGGSANPTALPKPTPTHSGAPPTPMVRQIIHRPKKEPSLFNVRKPVKKQSVNIT